MGLPWWEEVPVSGASCSGGLQIMLGAEGLGAEGLGPAPSLGVAAVAWGVAALSPQPPASSER